MILIKFPSKRDIWLVLILIGSIGFGLFIGVADFLTGKESITGSIFILLLNAVIIGFIGWIWFTTYYVLDENELIIRCGPINKRIPYKVISSAHKTMNPLSSPALSLKRINVTYQFGMALISPKDRDLFLTMLKERCPHASIKIENK